ncbi:MAG: hypothetical protein WBO70_04270, partial [Erysipelotrichaceae bacterium]
VKKYIRGNHDLISACEKDADEITLIRLQEQITSLPSRKISTYPKRVFKGKLLDDFIEIINIHENKDILIGPNKQVLTATKIHQELTRRGHKIAESTVRLRFSEYKNETKEVFIKQVYEYGTRVEYDFHQVKLVVGNTIKTFHQATIAIPSTNHYFIGLYPNEGMESAIDSIIDFINYCGGVYKEFVFDNMSTVVKRLSFKNNEKEYTDVITNSLAMKQLPFKLKSIYMTNYINNPKLFIENLYGCTNITKNDEIENTCVLQLNKMSERYA